nr:SpoIIE family protein phosphatase [Streptomyces himalayensis]
MPVARTSLPGNPLAPAAARRFVRAVLEEWAGAAGAGAAEGVAVAGVPGGCGSADAAATDAAVATDAAATGAAVATDAVPAGCAPADPVAGDVDPVAGDVVAAEAVAADEWAPHSVLAASVAERLIDDALVLVSELVTNAVVHAGTDVELLCRLEPPEQPEPPGSYVTAGRVAELAAYASGGRVAAAEPYAYTLDGQAEPAGYVLDRQAAEPGAYTPGGQAAEADAYTGDGHAAEAPAYAPDSRFAEAVAYGTYSHSLGAEPDAYPPDGHASEGAEYAPDERTTESGAYCPDRRTTGPADHPTDAEATGSLLIEVSDHHPTRAVRGDDLPMAQGIPEFGRGLQLVSALCTSWGVTYRPGTKTVWARLPITGVPAAQEIEAYAGESILQLEAYAGESILQRGLSEADVPSPSPSHGRIPRDQDWVNRGALSFLAEASDLLAGQLDEDLVAALAGQLLVPRFADWCAVWLNDEDGRAGWGTDGRTGGRHGGAGAGPSAWPRLARVWHVSENRIEELRRILEKEPPILPETPRSGAVPVPWPGSSDGSSEAPGAALAYRLIAGGRPLGTLVIGRAGLARFPDEITGLVEDFSRRVSLAIGAARQYARQATISRVLQRGLLPTAVAKIPGVESALVYEPRDKGGPGGDFYDVFPAGDGRWCFALGDVQGKGPEAAVVIGLARPWLRLLAREGYQVSEVLDRLNQLLLDDATEAADAAARAIAAVGGPEVPPEGSMPRFLSVLYGELVPTGEGMRCTLASAGHPLPLLLRPDGDVRAAAGPQVLLGVVEDVTYQSETFELRAGDTLLCVTDGVTERRSGRRQFDDGDGLAVALSDCAGLSAPLVAERIRRLVHEFADGPPEDDLALLVLQAQ